MHGIDHLTSNCDLNKPHSGPRNQNTTKLLCIFDALNMENIQLVIVDNTAAHALYIVGKKHSCSLCSSLKYTDS